MKTITKALKINERVESDIFAVFEEFGYKKNDYGELKERIAHLRERIGSW